MDERARQDPPPEATLADVVRHVEHVRDVAGVAHVGVGGDYDGSSFMPAGTGSTTAATGTGTGTINNPNPAPSVNIANASATVGTSSTTPLKCWT